MTGTKRRSSLSRACRLSLEVSKRNGAALGLSAITEGHEATVPSCSEAVKGPHAGSPANQPAGGLTKRCRARCPVLRLAATRQNISLVLAQE